MEQYNEGDWVVVLDTENVRQYNSGGIGYVFQLSFDNSKDVSRGTEFCSPTNKYGTNYRNTDIRLATPEEADPIKPKKLKKTAAVTNANSYPIY